MNPKTNSEKPQKAVDLHKIQRYKSFCSLFCMVVIYCLGMFFFGYCIGYLGSFQFSTIVTIFSISLDESLAFGLLTGCIPIGSGIGALLSFMLLKYFSRRNSLLIICVVAFIATSLTLVPNFVLLFVCRIIQGICVGLFSAISPLTIKQILPIQLSGSFGAFSGLFITFGTTFSFLVQFIVLSVIDSYEGENSELWRIQFGFPLLTLSLQFFMLLFVYNHQTPKYLLQEDREEQCKQLIAKIYKQEYVDEIMRQKKIDLGLLKPQTHEQSAQNINETQKQQNQQFGDKKPEHKACLRRFLSIDLSVFQQFVGTIPATSYGVLISSSVLPQLSILIPVLLNGVSAISTIVLCFLLSRIGRKCLLQFGTLLTIVALILITVGFFMNTIDGNIIVVVGLFLWMISFGMSINPIIWLYITEIIQPTFIMVPTMINWFTAALVAILFPILQEAIGSAGPIFAFFTGYTFIFFFINQRFIVQTKDKTQTEIYKQYDEVI